MTGQSPQGRHTRAVHPPVPEQPQQSPLSTPVWRSAAFRFGSAQEYADLLDGTRAGYSYSRIDNPSVDAMTAAVAHLEAPDGADVAHGSGDIGAQGFSSGMSAIGTTLLAHLSAGDHIVAPTHLYGGTYALLTNTLPRFGISTSFVDVTDLDAVAAAVTSNTRVLYAETLANPTLQVPDLQALATLAREAGALSVVDSTFATPSVCRPLGFGIDLVLHSATKFLAGHADVTAGVVIGREAALAPVTALRRELGTSLSPDDAWLVARGLLTLELRMERHCASASTLAEALEGHPAVEAVEHPSLTSSSSRDLADRQFTPGRYGGVLTVVPRGGRAAGLAFCDALRLIPIATSLGGVHSKVSHAASTTHRMFDDATLRAAGIAPAAVRLSVGLEDVQDLLGDCDQALGSISR